MAPKEFAKAIYGSVVAGLGALGGALAEDSNITALEGVTIATAIVVAFGVIFQVKNAPTEKE